MLKGVILLCSDVSEIFVEMYLFLENCDFFILVVFVFFVGLNLVMYVCRMWICIKKY